VFSGFRRAASYPTANGTGNVSGDGMTVRDTRRPVVVFRIAAYATAAGERVTSAGSAIVPVIWAGV
jgi:hypothetical protein